ncbi:MAG: cysteine hydrolase [Bacteroidales bacterium]|nr:cysteine hydrolase [Bacteroidales bacterium]
MKGLLIIDMQKVSFTPETPRFDAKGVIEKINLLSNNFRKNGDKVIFIQHDGTKDNFCIPNTSEWEILDELDRDSQDLVISKTANDSFYNSELNDILKDNGIDELIITGCATDFCVDSTVKSALTNNYRVTVISDGHTTGNRPHLSAEKVIEHYNWMWKETIPINGKITVLECKDYINL